MNISTLIVCLLLAIFRTSECDGSTVESVLFPFDGSLQSPCSGETVEVSGDIRVTTKVVQAPDGGSRFSMTIKYKNMKGMGLTTGGEFVVKDKSTVKQYTYPNGTATAIFTDKLAFRAKNPTARASFDTIFSITCGATDGVCNRVDIDSDLTCFP